MCRVNGVPGAKKRKRRTAFWLVIVTAISLTGCGGPGEGAGSDSKVSADSESKIDESAAMGRYVESMTEVDAGPIMDLVKLSDERLMLLEDGAVGRMVSADGGITWEEDMLPGWYELLSTNYIEDMKASIDGSVAVVCRNYGNNAATEEGQEEEAGEVSPKQSSGIYLVSKEGETQWVNVSLPEDENFRSVCFSEDGSRLFAASNEEKIYEIDRKTGDGKLFMTADTSPDVFCVWENYMAVKNETEGIFLYDMDTTERITDDVLSDFVTQNCTGNDRVLVSTYSIFPAEESGLYLVCSKGVYRHVIGGAVMEQVINGGLSSFSDPTRHISKMLRTKEEGFLAAFSEGRISAFTYDSNISTIPSQVFTAYSLTESTVLRQAIMRYQGKNPDVYVEYKVGMDEDGGVTREDAIKKLNAEIMAGKGPDFLILDGLPADSYINKGVLADMGPYLEDLEKEEKILSNIKESFTKDGKIHMIPAAITLPMYMTDEGNTANVTDLCTLADMFEKLRSVCPGEEIMEVYSEDMLLDTLMPVSAPLWLTESGQLNSEEMSDYLEQAKRIYDACMEGLPEKVLEKYREREGNERWVMSTDEVGAYNDLQGGAIQIVADNVQVTMGELNNAYNYAFLQSVRKNENAENCQVFLTPGSVKDSFCPLALMGINAVSDKADLAGGLVQEVLSKEMQSMIYPVGFPVNEEGLSEYLDSLGGMLSKERQTPGEKFSGYGFSSEEGEVITLSLYVPTEQESQKLYETLASVHTPYLSDVVMEEAVREAGEQYLDGRCTLEEAVEMIQKKTEIYMAE